MQCPFRARVALCAFLLAAFGAASASAQTVISHESDYAFDGVSALYDAFDTYSSPTAVSFAPSVTILGDPTSFAWTETAPCPSPTSRPTEIPEPPTLP